MKRDLRSKKMPAKPMQEAQADEELALDMPMSDEEMGNEEADEDMLMDEESAEPSPLDDASDDDLIAEMKKRGLDLDGPAEEESEEPEEELPA